MGGGRAPAYRAPCRKNNIALRSSIGYIQLMQPSLFASDVHAELVRTEHGGSVRRGRRKLERPVSVRRPMHVVLTSHRARGPWSLRKHERAVRDALRAMAERFGIRIYDFRQRRFSPAPARSRSPPRVVSSISAVLCRNRRSAGHRRTTRATERAIFQRDRLVADRRLGARLPRRAALRVS